VTEGEKVSGVIRKIWKGEGMSRDAKPIKKSKEQTKTKATS
jgi:hypothetical protein